MFDSFGPARTPALWIIDATFREQVSIQVTESQSKLRNNNLNESGTHEVISVLFFFHSFHHESG